MEEIPRLRYEPPLVGAMSVPSSVVVFVELGVYAECDMNEALKDASDAGLILPRHSDRLIFLSVSEVELSILRDNKSSWEPYDGDGWVLCYFRPDGVKRLFSFENISKICKHNIDGHCDIEDRDCHELFCRMWHCAEKRVED